MNIGQKIKEIADKKNLSQKMVGDLINEKQQNVGNDYKKSSLSFDKLLIYSKALDHNFIQYYYNDEPFKSYREEEYKQWDEKINSLKEQFDQANRLISMQEETIQTQKELIYTQKALIESLSGK
ncbi:helix-turn-helix transcriptional regulator [Sphingobacterium multivorum]|uniref:Uncharacterized protein n=1 Tax=Sphingobacterium multivorum TaxID=28454 RepID=A0A2X2J8D3_SPHMU|nr:helix-turn-helix transcriptional regulator [Sphingobacterium multivorum]QRQ61214.1 helix-turn-helix transcriptional regulator [Sphingobacterium multivorum]SPZ85234.1 Uncharacterised protein [Sphingobacterium multivorum]SPZ88491.1 Uncharacterised protein [Sphingobacterium multivorum]